MKPAIFQWALAGSIIAGVMPALASNPRLAVNPAGGVVCVESNPAGVVAYYSPNPLAQPWSTGSTVSLLAGGETSLLRTAYTGEGRFLVAWATISRIYTSFTDDNGQTWSTPDLQAEMSGGQSVKSLGLAADPTGTILINWTGYKPGNYTEAYSLFQKRSVDRGVSFSSAEPGLNDDGSTFTGVSVGLATNGVGTWYRMRTQYVPLQDLLQYYYNLDVQTSLDGGLTWQQPQSISSSLRNYEMFLGAAPIANKATLLTFNGDFISFGKFSFTSTANNGSSWLNNDLAADLPLYHTYNGTGPLYKRNADIATDSLGNMVVLYEAKFTDAPDPDILAIKTTNAGSLDWDTSLRFVSRQEGRNETAPVLACLGDNTFLTALDITDNESTNSRGILTMFSTDAGATWTTGTFVTGSVNPGNARSYTVVDPAPPAKFAISSVTPKIKYKEPKPGKPPKPRKATFKVVIGATPELTAPETAQISLYVSNNDTVSVDDLQLYNGTIKKIKPRKSGKTTIKLKDFPDPAGKYVIIQVNGAAPYALAM